MPRYHHHGVSLSVRFTADAREYAARMEPTVILVDGAMLAELMIDHEVGVTTEAVYALKRVDSDFFDEE